MCISTNGLALPGRAADLIEAGVRTLTVTVNAVDPEVLAGVVSWIRADADLITAQLQGIAECAALGMTIKVNTVLIPGVNDHHIADIAQAVRRAGATMMNIIPLIPQNEFIDTEPPSCLQVEQARQVAETWLGQFRHCAHCRADACGIPGISEFASELYQDAELETFSHG
jgi:nitrogen fixation protein NifB